ncbi:hypothetical protein CMI45_02690 [Candidatus Pacearchaeota archaeon]|nr:hypothetical protein [Candidatus Pacearchaeota archaeon]|tara:strand:+ start:162 stop:521 length:360 start_codon:yes stop_codon:yes gene_type:complete
MKLEDRIDSTEMREKLNHLEDHVPGLGDDVYEFGRLLSGRLSEVDSMVIPAGYNLLVEVLLFDLVEGFDGMGEPIISELSGDSSKIYQVEKYIEQITNTVCPEKFAQKVNAFRGTMSRY